MLYNMLKRHFIAVLSVFTGVLLFLALCALTKAYSERVMNGLTSEVFRFHVLANSDSGHDQRLKLIVRDKILENYEAFLTESHSKKETMDFFECRLDEIENMAEKILKENGCLYSVNAEVTKSGFPLRKYGDVTLPAGVYDCLKISIGNACGHNWWCVMFPPLCYTEATYEEVNSDKNLKEAFDDDTRAIVLAESEKSPPEVKVKLKIVELWQNRNYKNQKEQRALLYKQNIPKDR